MCVSVCKRVSVSVSTGVSDHICGPRPCVNVHVFVTAFVTVCEQAWLCVHALALARARVCVCARATAACVNTCLPLALV